jgi:hypothetical protein
VLDNFISGEITRCHLQPAPLGHDTGAIVGAPQPVHTITTTGLLTTLASGPVLTNLPRYPMPTGPRVC